MPDFPASIKNLAVNVGTNQIQRMKRVVIVLLVLFNTLEISCFSQNIPCFSLQYNPEILWKKNHANPVITFNNGLSKPDSLPAVKMKPTPLMAYFHTRHWGFFCAQELKLEKTIRFPLKMRLGSVEYVDRMEGKRR
jgi:hypothetical protein